MFGTPTIYLKKQKSLRPTLTLNLFGLLTFWFPNSLWFKCLYSTTKLNCIVSKEAAFNPPGWSYISSTGGWIALITGSTGTRCGGVQGATLDYTALRHTTLNYTTLRYRGKDGTCVGRSVPSPGHRALPHTGQTRHVFSPVPAFCTFFWLKKCS